MKFRLLGKCTALCLAVLIFAFYSFPINFAEGENAPVLTPDVVAVSDDFEGYGATGTTIPAGTEYKWDTVTTDTLKGVRTAADPKGNAGTVAEFWGNNTSAGQKPVIQKSVDITQPIVISGNVLLEQTEAVVGSANRATNFVIGFRDNASSTVKTLLNFTDKYDGRIWIGAGTTTFGRWAGGEWINYNILLTPNVANPAKSKISIVLSGPGVLNASGTAALLQTWETIDLSAIKTFNNPYLTFTAGMQTAKTDSIFTDNMQIYQPNDFWLSITNNTNVGLSDTVRVDFNHSVNQSTLNTSKVHVRKLSGESVALSSVDFDPLQPDHVILHFANILAADTVYHVSIEADVRDMANQMLSNAVTFNTGASIPPNGVIDPVGVTQITIKPTTLTLPADFPLDAIPNVAYLPVNSTNNHFLWVSSNPQVATVDPITGNIKPVAQGVTTVTAKATDSGAVVSNDCVVTITPTGNHTGNQKMNLEPTTTPRININEYLAWPTNYGDAHVALWSDNKIGAFSITVDDGLYGDFNVWNGWKEKYGFPITFFGPTGLTGTMAFNQTEWQKMVDYGQDIQSHTKYHLSTTAQKDLTSAQWIEDFNDSKLKMNTLNGADCKTIGYSYGTGDIDYARQFYIAGRTGVGFLNDAATVDYMQVNSLSMVPTTGPLAYQNVNNSANLEAAFGALYDTYFKFWNKTYYGGWTDFHSHAVASQTFTNEQLGANTTVQKMLDYMFENYLAPHMDKIYADSFTNVAMYGQERDTSTLAVTSKTANEVRFTLTDEMADDYFDFPLTVKVKVDSSWSSVSAMQNTTPIAASNVKIVEQDGNTYVLVKAVPDRGEVVLTANGAPPEKSTNAKLSSLTYQAQGGSVENVTGFSTADDSKTYHVELAYGTSSVTIGATKADTGATLVKTPEDGVVTITNGSAIATIEVTAEDGITKNTYTVNFTVSLYTLSGPYIMPDPYNTGYKGNFEDLQEIEVKYPSLTRESNGRIKISQSGIYENFKVTGGGLIYIDADNVTLRNFFINGQLTETTGAGGIENRANIGLLVENGEITHTSPSAVTSGTGSVILRKLHIHDVVSDGVKVENNAIIESCYIHHCGMNNPLAHADGIQTSGSPGGSNNIKIMGNRIDVPHLPFDYNATSDIMIKSDFGQIDGVEIKDNWLNGGTYSVYIVDLPNSGYFVTNSIYSGNKLGTGAIFGQTSFVTADTPQDTDNIAINSLGVGSIMLQDESGQKVENFDTASGTIKCVANMANYTGSAKSGILVGALYKDGVLFQEETNNFEVERYINYNEYSQNNLAEEVINGSSFWHLVTQPAKHPTDVKKEVTLTIPAGSTEYTLKVLVWDDLTSLTPLREETFGAAMSEYPIISLDINTPANLDQTMGPELVAFTAIPTPAQNVNLGSIEWYVNGQKQTETGYQFDFTPPDVGTYEVCAKVGTAVVSRVRTVSVTGQSVTPDEVVVYDNFEDYGNEGTVVPSGNQNKWTNGSNSLIVGTDTSRGKIGKFISTSATQNISIQKKTDMNYEPIIMSGKMRIDGNYNLGYNYSIQLRNTIAPANVYTAPFGFNSNGQITSGPKWGPQKWVPGQWISYIVYIKPNMDDLTKSDVTTYFAGGFTNGTATEQTQGYVKVAGQKIDLAMLSNGAATLHLEQPFLQSKVTLPANATSLIYMDDIKIYKPKSFTMGAAKSTGVALDEAVTINFNHAVDLSTLSKDKVTVNTSGGTAIPVQSLDVDTMNPDHFVLHFEANAIAAGTTYTVTLADSVKDMAEYKITGTAKFSTAGAVVTAPVVTANDLTNTITGLDLSTMEYAVSTDAGATYGAYTSVEPSAFGGSKVVKVRVKAAGTSPASADTILTFTPNAGDVNGDGIIDISDVIMAAEIAVGSTGYTSDQVLRANVSDKTSAIVDIADVILIAEHAVGSTTPFPVEL